MFRGRKKSVDTSSTTSGGRRTSLDVISTTTGSSFRDSEGPTQGVFIVKWSDGSTSELVPTKIQQDQPVRGGSKQKRKALAKRDKTAVEDDVSSTDENEASFAARLKVKKFEVPKSPLRPKNSLETVTSTVVIPAPVMTISAPALGDMPRTLEEKFMHVFKPRANLMSWNSLFTSKKVDVAQLVDAEELEALKLSQNEIVSEPQHVDTPIPDAPVAQAAEVVQERVVVAQEAEVVVQQVTFAAKVDERFYEPESSYKGSVEEWAFRVDTPSPDLFAMVDTPSPEGERLGELTQAVAAGAVENAMEGGAQGVAVASEDRSLQQDPIGGDHARVHQLLSAIYKGAQTESPVAAEASVVNDDDSQQDLFGGYYESLDKDAPVVDGTTEAEEEDSELVLELAAEDSASGKDREALVVEMAQAVNKAFAEKNEEFKSVMDFLLPPGFVLGRQGPLYTDYDTENGRLHDGLLERSFIHREASREREYLGGNDELTQLEG